MSELWIWCPNLGHPNLREPWGRGLLFTIYSYREGGRGRQEEKISMGVHKFNCGTTKTSPQNLLCPRLLKEHTYVHNHLEIINNLGPLLYLHREHVKNIAFFAILCIFFYLYIFISATATLHSG